jgi:hypothetical protein
MEDNTSSANPPAITNFGEPIALRPADNANGTVRPSLSPCCQNNISFQDEPG